MQRCHFHYDLITPSTHKSGATRSLLCGSLWHHALIVAIEVSITFAFVELARLVSAIYCSVCFIIEQRSVLTWQECKCFQPFITISIYEFD